VNVIPLLANSQSNPHTTTEMQREISAALTRVSEETRAAFVRNFRRRLLTAMDADGTY
jgi:hypothetical protein